MKKAIYTVLTNDYEHIPACSTFEGWDSYLFTDSDVQVETGWKVIKIEKTNNPILKSREIKLLIHKFLPDYELYCYHDANIILRKEPPYFNTFIQHPRRFNIEQEALRCIELKKDDAEILMNQLKVYKNEGFTDHSGLFMNGWFVRPNEPKFNQAYELWYEQLTKHSHRDQISLPYILWKTNLKLEARKLGALSKYFILNQHKHNEVKGVNVHYITPGRSDKMYGMAVNQIIKGLPDNDWICLRDIDTLVLNHEILFKQVDEVIKQHGQDYALLSCMTNDLGLKYQLVGEVINKSYNLVEHRTICDNLIKESYADVRQINNTVGGFFMLFSKKTWKKAGGLIPGIANNRGQFFDFCFSKEVLNIGGKIGVCTGIYVYHFCRYGKPRSNTKHLIK